jgi:competence protein ComEC
MLPRPGWLAIGVIFGAGTVSYAPIAADSAVAVLAASVVALALGVAACLARIGGRRSLAAALVIATLGASLVAARLAIGLAAGGGGPPNATSLPPGTGPWVARVESAHLSKGQQIATISIADQALRCSAQMPAYPRLVAGDTISWSGEIAALGDSDYERFLAAQGIDSTCRATDLAIVAHDDSPAGRLEALRQASGDALQQVLPEPEGGLAAAILIGLRDRVDRNLAAAFTTAGVSHIVAISGWNIAIVAATVATLLRSRFRRRTRALVTILAIVAYTLFAGASASVLRAAVMAGVAMMAVESGRGSRAMVGLAWAVAILILVEPVTVADVGFQLSAVATAGLVAWASPLTAWLGSRAPRLPASLRESLGVSLTAQAATLPIALLTFGRLALIAPAANLIAVPLVPPVMAAGAVAFGAGWLQMAGVPAPLPGLLAMPAALLLGALVTVVDAAASVPGANETLPFPANVAAAGVAAALLVAMGRALARFSRPAHGARQRAQASTAGGGSPSRAADASSAGGAAGARTAPAAGARTAAAAGKWPRIGRWWRVTLAGAAMLAVLAGNVVAARPDGSVHVIVLDVGQGDSILLEGDRGGRILIDGGPDPNVLMTDLDRYIPTWDRRLDAIVLTHPHDDHVAGLVAVVQRYRVGRAFESGWSANTAAYRAWKSALAARGVPTELLATGETLELDDATLRVLWPDDGSTRPAYLDPTATDNRKTNDASIVFLGEFEGRKFLLTGDVEDDVDPILLSRGLPTLDMLKVAHHGSATASSDVLLATLRPSIAVVSVGADNTYGHPSGATMARLRAHASKVFRTDHDGTVETTLDGADVTVVASHAGSGGAADSGADSGVALGGTTRREEPLPAAAVPSFALLYASTDVYSQPSRERGIAAVTRSTAVAPPPLAGRCRSRGLAGLAGSVCRSLARSPPRRSGRAAA